MPGMKVMASLTKMVFRTEIDLLHQLAINRKEIRFYITILAGTTTKVLKWSAKRTKNTLDLIHSSKAAKAF